MEKLSRRALFAGLAAVTAVAAIPARQSLAATTGIARITGLEIEAAPVNHLINTAFERVRYSANFVTGEYVMNGLPCSLADIPAKLIRPGFGEISVPAGELGACSFTACGAHLQLSDKGLYIGDADHPPPGLA